MRKRPMETYMRDLEEKLATARKWLAGNNTLMVRSKLMEMETIIGLMKDLMITKGQKEE